ncbi:Formimidoyltetrahydrofolate cyclodeaminase [Streptococcus parauberis]|uniref:Formiminotetrahydrofolate cyclodeaminase n=1 Tax=Streptococcus parauberis KRS-02083 TaxID=1207545 RepID=A0ABN0IUA4_9STRE|nr:cyclodeaminase/cyclohydrolase family protein [Streptococcus parauberis]AUT05614.1 Formimidoyltetrahydrofolate cyclodeaminase [Streptococcus parauberis]EMG26366.1 Formiminotetrahydrofolate cyclodeaminase [Streptococcus parauberis KRS-02083]UWV11044.1 cyclodeaminase/cyclohydrolase family protein [Streptococcus parauberis]WEM60767.1 cyclodeaminase/cyclohydrolase family protein [Streptococcus parauberis]WOF47588.1 cyclodeaminase/cyclohydrolase family protein [Streptococcus parauberis]
MKLVDLSLFEFAQVLGSDAPAPGGGSAAALSAANGISLTKMVCELTLGKKKYADEEALIKTVHEASSQLQMDLLAAIDKDTEAFNLVSAVFDMPKETDNDKLARRQAMQNALKEATKSPFSMMEQMLEAIKVTEKAVGHTNTNAASDLGVAALNLKAGLQGAWLNVLINLAGIKDTEFVDSYETRGQSILEEGSQLADKIYTEVLHSL